MTAIYKRELKSYYHGVTGSIFTAFLLLMTGLYMTAYNLSGTYPNFEIVLSSLVFVFLLLIPLITMRSFSEDLKGRTDQILYSLPLKLSSVVLAKYLAMLTVLAVPLSVMCLYPLILSFFGTVNFASAYSAIVGFFLLGAALTAVGMFLSSLTESQVIAAVLTFGAFILMYLMSGLVSLFPVTATASLFAFLALSAAVGLVFYVLTKHLPASAGVALALMAVVLAVYLFAGNRFAGAFPALLSALQLFGRFNTFANGLFDLTAAVYYLSISVLFVFLTVQSLEKRRWS